MALSMTIIKHSFLFFKEHVKEICYKIIPVVFLTSYISDMLIDVFALNDDFF
jgi:hypothetical protein